MKLELGTLAALFAASFSLGGCAGATPVVLAADGKPVEHTLSVVGSARVEVVPDEACIELTLAARDPSMAAAHAELDRDRGIVSAGLRQDRELVVEDGTIRYEPEYESDGAGRSRLARYVAAVQINVRTKSFARIAEVIARGAEHGLDRVNVVYYANDMVARRAEVRARAVEAAKEKARAMAAGLDIALGDVVSVAEGDAQMFASTGPASYLGRGTVDSAPDVPAPPGSIPLSMNVNVVYRLR